MEEIKEVLKKLPFFPPLDENQLQQMATKFKLQKYAVNTILFAEGDAGDLFYIIKSGEVKILKSNQEIARLKDGDYFGEMALLTGEVRSATVETSQETEIIYLSKKDFDDFLKINPSVAINLSKTLSRRLAQTKVVEKVKEEKEKIAQIISVYAVSSRLGKTTLITNLAIFLANNLNKKVILLDLDLQFGDIDLSLNLKPELTIYDLVKKTDVDRDLIFSHLKTYNNNDNLRVLMAPSQIEQAELVDEHKITKIIEILKTEVDFILIDTNSHLGGASLTGLDLSNKILFLITGDISLMKKTQMCLKVMDTLGYPKDKIMLAYADVELNQQDINAERLEKIFQQKIYFNIPNDTTLGKAAIKGEPQVLLNPKSNYVALIEKIANFINGEAKGETAEGDAKPKSKGGLFGGLFGKK